jgi:hypothetical protein
MTFTTPLFYLLDDNNNVIVTHDVVAWGEFMEDFTRRRVAETTLHDNRWISTVFLGVDHQFGIGLPITFETMVFPYKGEYMEGFAEPDSPWNEEYQERYATWDEAYKGHWRIVREHTLSLCEEVS